jgi:hypothetical protein
MTNDLRRRLYEHRNDLIDGFSNQYRYHRLVLLRIIRTTGAKHHKKLKNSNYQRNLPEMTPVPRMALVWVTKLFSSVPMKKLLAR